MRALGYAAFWLYWLDRYLGMVSSILYLAGAVALVVRRQTRHELRNVLAHRDVWIPTLLMFVGGLFYLGYLFAYDRTYVPQVANDRYFLWLMPDNDIPRLFAERLYSGLDPRNLVGDWLSSDRPPLQTGIVLLQRPFHLVAPALQYQIIGTVAQCAWIPAVWALCRSLRLPGRSIAVVFGFLSCSGFFLVNATYVWPKLLAGSLMLGAYLLLFDGEGTGSVRAVERTVLAAGLAALGCLAHMGVAFTLLAMGILLVMPMNFPGVRATALGLLVFALLMVPWKLYQTYYEPPGNRLVKWHIGGSPEIDARGTIETLLESYGRLSLSEIASNKWTNLKVAAGVEAAFAIPHFQFGLDREGVMNRQAGEHYQLGRSLGVLNAGWLAVFPGLVLSRRLRGAIGERRRQFVRLFGVFALSAGIWVLLMFEPGSTLTYQGSYASVVLVFTGLAAVVSLLPSVLRYSLLALHLANFLITWVLEHPPA